jgi:CBS domain-containing protein
MATLDSLTVKDYMSTNLVTFTADMEMTTVINTLVKNRISGGSVVDSTGKVIGFISEKDCIKVGVTAGYEGVPAGTVAEYMMTGAVYVSPDMPMLELAGRFLNTAFKRFPVVSKEGQLVGQISRLDVLRAINDVY